MTNPNVDVIESKLPLAPERRELAEILAPALGAQPIGTGGGMVFTRAGKVRFPQVGDGVTDVGQIVTKFWTSLQGTGKTLEVDSGKYLNGMVYPAANGFYICAAPDAVFSTLLLANGNVQLVGASGIEGGVWQYEYCQPWTITEAEVVSNVARVRCPGHNLQVGHSIRCHLVVGLGLINDVAKTITAVAGDDIYFAHTNGDASATIPYERNDLYNTSPKALHPYVQMTRTSAFADSVILVQESAVAFHLRDLTARYCRINPIALPGAGHGHIHNVSAEDSAADGIHMARGSHHLRFTGHTKVRRSGDAAFGIISYRTHGQNGLCHDITIEYLDVGDVLFNGAGLDLIGGERISIERYTAENTYGPGIKCVSDNSSYYTYGLRDVRIGHATLRTCGSNPSTIPAGSGWEGSTQPALVFTGGPSPSAANEHRAVCGLHFDLLEIFNPRYRAIGGTGLVKRVTADEIRLYGVPTIGANLGFILDWKVKRFVADEIGANALTAGGSAVSGQSVFDDIELLHINNGSPIEILSGACDGTTVTYITKTAHGLSGTPKYRTVGFRSAYTNSNGATAATEQDKDFALNGNWGPKWAASTNYAARDIRVPTTPNGFAYIVIVDAGSSGGSEPTWPTTLGATVVDGGITWMCKPLDGYVGYATIAFPDTTTIQMTGTGLAATVSPVVYSESQKIPQAVLYKGGTASTDGVLVESGAPHNSIIIKRLRLLEQHLPLERLVEDLTNAGVRIWEAIDLSGITTQLANVGNDDAELSATPALQRYHTGPYTGAPAAAVVAANTIYIVPVLLTRGTLVNRLGFRVTTLETGADARMAIFKAGSNDLVYAAAEQVDAFNSTGDKEVPLQLYLPRGLYFLALITNATGTGQILWHTIDAAERAGLFDSASSSQMDLGSPDFRLTMAQTYGALPSTLTIARNSATTEPHLWLRWGV
jgi:hypothetical protein